MGVKNAFYAIKFFTQTHAPEILVGIGLVGMAGTVALTCKAMLNVADILEDHKDFVENGVFCCEEVRADLIKQDKKDTTIAIVKKVAPPVVMFAGSTACILAGFGILKTRYAASVAAYSALSQAYDLYRDRIKTKYGDEADEFGLYGIETIEETVKNPETGKKETVKKQVISDDRGIASPYTRAFDRRNPDLKSGSKFYETDEASNTAFLNAAREQLEMRYQRYEPLRINDIYKAFGFDQEVAYDYNKIILWKGHKGDPEFVPGEHFIDIYHERSHVNDCGYGAEDIHSVWWVTPFVPKDEIQQEMKDKLEEINYDRSRV